MKKSMFSLALLISSNVFAGCLDNFRYVVEHNKSNLELKEQVLVSGNEIQQELILLKAKLYEITVDRRIDNKTKKLIAHQDRMIRFLEGKQTDEDLDHLFKKVKKTKKISKVLFETQLASALSNENSFCLSTAGDLSDQYDNFDKLARNTTEITYGNVVDEEHMRKAIVPKTEKEIVRLILRQ